MSGKSNDNVFGSWFKDAGDPERNPVKLAQIAMRTPLPERFYKSADIVDDGGAFHLVLDGRKARTPAKAPIALANREAAMLVAREWNAQIGVINPAEMHATRIVNAAIDHVSGAMAAVADEIVKYAGSDLICYRASEPERLVERQALIWDPLVAWARQDLGVALNLAEGVVFVAQSADALDAIRGHVARFDDPASLSALHVLTTLGGSVILSLAVASQRLSPTDAYDASELEADFTSEVWGIDEEAAFRRSRRRQEFEAAARLLLALQR